MARPPLTHLTPAGATMVDVGEKPLSRRRAVAEATVRISPDLRRAIVDQTLPKGSFAEVVRLAGIQAAKATSQLIPLCHPLPLDVADVAVALEPEAVRITATVIATARTGVEMEALTAAAVAALTVIDMGKAVDRGMAIERVRLLEKTGGTRGDYAATPPEPAGGRP